MLINVRLLIAGSCHVSLARVAALSRRRRCCFGPHARDQIYDIKYMREAEIKHGRTAMLACLGYVSPEIFPWMKVRMRALPLVTRGET
jgi:hypothetical protein